MASGQRGVIRAVVIDGYNLIMRVPDLNARLGGPQGLHAARSYLLGWLRRYQAARQRRVVLVLDGPAAGRSDFGPVEVIYADPADAAVTGLAGPATLVVTSDREVAGLALAKGAEVLASEDFWTAMIAAAGGRARRRAGAETVRDGDEDPGEEDGAGRAPSGGRRPGAGTGRHTRASRRRQRELRDRMGRV